LAMVSASYGIVPYQTDVLIEGICEVWYCVLESWVLNVKLGYNSGTFISFYLLH
jgi:hypothetical protein